MALICGCGVLLHSSTKKRSIYTKEKGGRSRWSRSSVSGEDGEMNRVGDGLSLFSCPQRGKNGGVSARGTKSSFQASSAKRTGTGSSRQRVRCHKKHGKLSSKVVGPSASLHFIFCSLVQNSDPGARTVLCRFIYTERKRKRKNQNHNKGVKRFKLQLKSAETRTIYQLQKLELGSQIQG